MMMSVTFDAVVTVFANKKIFFCARFGDFPVIIKRKLFQSFCLFLYGSQLRDLSHKELDTAWRKAIRRGYNFLPNVTHSAILTFFMDGNDFHAFPLGNKPWKKVGIVSIPYKPQYNLFLTYILKVILRLQIKIKITF